MARKNRTAAARAFRRDMNARTVSGPTVLRSVKMTPDQLREHLMLGTRARTIPGKRDERRGGRAGARRAAIASD